MNDATYFAQRMKVLGVTKDNNKIALKDPDVDFPGVSVRDWKVFEEDKDGNIQINYWTIDGLSANYWYDSGSRSRNDKVKHFNALRLKEPKGDMKYKFPKGQGSRPWFPPSLVEKFKAGTPINTLYLTEGAFKAWTGAQHGLDVVGLGSITHYKDADGQLYYDVRRLIETCKVEHVVILWDADCRDISIKALTRGEELTTRPAGFFWSAHNIRKLLRGMTFKKSRDAPRVHFMHPKREKFEDKPKGLDDYLVTAAKEQVLDKVVADIVNPTRKGEYFYRTEITTTSRRLNKYFGLDKAKGGVDDFHALHAEQIGEQQFFHYGDLYTYIDATQALELIAPGWASQLAWVGDDFFVKCKVPSAKEGSDRYKLIPRKKETLTYHQGKEFQDYLTYFTGFCNRPSHYDYQSIVESGGHKFFNRYFPFEHVSEEGPYAKTLGFVKHIFGSDLVEHPVTGAKIERWEMGLDYIKILLEHPTQILPVLCLYSQENNTGKSTFCKLLAQVFRNNAIFVSNSDFQSDFNATFADKLLVMCEETMLERKRETERIKAMSTANEITVNEKGVSQYSIDFFAKFIFCSNNRRMVNVGAKDERFWILKVPKSPVDNPRLLDEMIDEIPGFLHFLRERPMSTENESRMHFKPQMILTESFHDTVEVNEPGQVSNLRAGIQEMFDELPVGTSEILMPMKNIREEFFNKGDAVSWVQEVLRDYLSVEPLRDASGKQVNSQRGTYHRIETRFNGEEHQEHLVTVNWTGRPYVFRREDFVEEEMEVEVGGDGIPF